MWHWVWKSPKFKTQCKLYCTNHNNCCICDWFIQRSQT